MSCIPTYPTFVLINIKSIWLVLIKSWIFVSRGFIRNPLTHVPECAIIFQKTSRRAILHSRQKFVWFW